jgi:hypothetical protein
MKSSPHLGHFILTPSTFAEIAFAQATSKALLQKTPRPLKKCLESCQFYKISLKHYKK